AKKWKSASAVERIELERLNKSIGESIGAKYHSASGLWTKDGKILFFPDDKTQAVVDEMKENGRKWNSANDEERQRLRERNQELGRSIGAKYDSSTGIWYKHGLRLYHKGGIVG